MAKQSRKRDLIMSKVKITKTELQKNACFWMKHTGLNETEISDKLGVDIDTIILWTREYNQKNNTNNSKKKSSLFINETAGKKNKMVSIMTKEASERSDDNRKSLPSNQRSQNHIFRPND